MTNDTFDQAFSSDDLRLLFKAVPDQDLILTPDFRIAAATAAYLKNSGREINDIRGQLVFDAFPDNPNDPHDGLRTLKDSLERVRKTLKADRMAPFRYDVAVRTSQGDVFKERYWSPTNSPVLDESGKLKFIVHRVTEVTSSILLKRENRDFAARLKDQDNELLLRVVADQLPAFVSYMGADHRYKFVNAFYARWFDLPTSQIEGKTRSEVVSPQATSAPLSDYEERAFSGRRCAFEVTLTKPSGEFINLDTEYIPDFDPITGQVVGIVRVGLDVTSRKIALQEAQLARQKAEESELRFRNLSASLPTLMWTWREDIGVFYINKRAMEYLGIASTSDFGPAFINSLLDIEGIDAQRSWYHGVATRQPFKTEVRIRGVDGVARWFLTQASPILDETGEIEYWISSATDIDEQRRTSQELYVAKNAAEDANRAKTEFLANMSHEIRTPLNAILGFSELMRDPELKNAERDQYASTISRNGRLLTRIIDDILDLAKVESGRMEAEEVPFALGELIDETMALFTDSAKQKGIGLKRSSEGRAPAWIASDPTRLRQILINVIGNAVKFTDQGSVEIGIDSRSDGDDCHLMITVRDTGRGVSESQRERLFKPFTQADTSTTRRYGGTGLGLALSRRLAETLGGTLELSDEPQDRGATFIIRLVTREVSPQPKAAAKILGESLKTQAPDLSRPLDGLRVLVVDDSVDNQMLVRHILKKLGAIVDVAGNGREGLRVALENSHDVVLMDIQMPEMDGYQAMAGLQSASFKAPVIALTAHALNEEREKTRAAGFVTHLTKPIDKQALLDALMPYQN